MSGPAPVGFDVAGDPAAWGALGFVLDGGRCTIGDVVLAIGQSSPPLPAGLIGWTLAPATADSHPR